MNDKEIKTIQKMDLKKLQFQQTFSLAHMEKIAMNLEEKIDRIDKHVHFIAFIVLIYVVFSGMLFLGIFLKINGYI